MFSSDKVQVSAPTGGHKYGTCRLSMLVFYSAANGISSLQKPVFRYILILISSRV